MTVLALAGPKGSGKSTVAAWLSAERGFTEVSLAGDLKRLARELFPRTITEAILTGPSDARDRPFTAPQLRLANQELGAASAWLRLDPEGRKRVEGLFGRPTLGPDGELVGVTPRIAGDALVTTFSPAGDHLASPRRILQLLGTEWGRALDAEVWLRAAKAVIAADRSKKYVVSDVRFANEADYLRRELDARVYWVAAERRLAGRPHDPHASEPVRGAFPALPAIPNEGDMADLRAKLTELFPE